MRWLRVGEYGVDDGSRFSNLDLSQDLEHLVSQA
jgi:hypothetical protein